MRLDKLIDLFSKRLTLVSAIRLLIGILGLALLGAVLLMILGLNNPWLAGSLLLRIGLMSIGYILFSLVSLRVSLKGAFVLLAAILSLIIVLHPFRAWLADDTPLIFLITLAAIIPVNWLLHRSKELDTSPTRPAQHNEHPTP